MIVKAAPEMGSANDITIVQKIKPGKGTGLHYHTDADEIFYIMEGTGNITLGNKSYNIEVVDQKQRSCNANFHIMVIL